MVDKDANDAARSCHCPVHVKVAWCGKSLREVRTIVVRGREAEQSRVLDVWGCEKRLGCPGNTGNPTVTFTLELRLKDRQIKQKQTNQQKPFQKVTNSITHNEIARDKFVKPYH